MAIEVTHDSPSKPLIHDLSRCVASAFQLVLDSQQRRTHSPLDRHSQYLKLTASVLTYSKFQAVTSTSCSPKALSAAGSRSIMLMTKEDGINRQIQGTQDDA